MSGLKRDDISIDYTKHWQKILPESVVIICGSPADITQSIDTKEIQQHIQALPKNLATQRQQELIAGQILVRKALEKIGVQKTALSAFNHKNNSSGEYIDGPPTWPDGYVGSVTHTRADSINLITVAVAKQSDLKSLGIDAETDTKIHPSIWPQFLNSDEINRLQECPADYRLALASMIWSVKESAIKATEINLRSEFDIKFEINKAIENIRNQQPILFQVKANDGRTLSANAIYLDKLLISSMLII